MKARRYTAAENMGIITILPMYFIFGMVVLLHIKKVGYKVDFIDFKELKYFIGCNQDNSYYYDIIHNKICDIDDIASELSVDKSEFADNCFYYNCIPLPCLDISDAFDNFITSLNNKKISEYFKDIDKCDALNYWLKFDKIFHVGFERRLWDEYYDNYVHKKAVDWCKDYSIRYC